MVNIVNHVLTDKLLTLIQSLDQVPPCTPDPNNAGRCLMTLDDGSGGSYTSLAEQCDRIGGYLPRPLNPTDLAFLDTLHGGSRMWVGLTQDEP